MNAEKIRGEARREEAPIVGSGRDGANKVTEFILR